MQPTELKIKLIAKRNFWSKLKKNKQVELKIKNLGTHQLQILSIPTDPDKVHFKYIETEKKKDEFSYPIMIQENESKKLGITIKSSFKEWFWSGTNLKNISMPIYTSTASDPQNPEVSPCETKIPSARRFWILLVAPVILLSAIALFLFLRQPEQDVVISSYPHGKTVYIDRKPTGTTPTWLRVKEKAIIQIGDSPEYSVKEVLEDGLIFYREKKKKSQNEQ